MKVPAFAAAAFLLAVPSFAQAQSQSGRPEAVSSGATIRIYNVFSCGRNIIGGVSGSASHGTITTRDTKQNRCNEANHDATEVLYTAERGYHGPDEATVFWRGGSKRIPIIVR